MDAGHGGKDPGVTATDGLTEQLLCLQIARKVEALAPAYNVEVVLTRKDEQLPGNHTDPTEANRWRVNLANSLQPALFLSIHINGSLNTALNGIEIYVPDQNGTNPNKVLSREAAQIFRHQLNELLPVTGIKQREKKGIWVLEQSLSPALMVECGFITNPADFSYIREDVNQEKIARKLLEAAVLFAGHQKKTN